MTLNDLFSDLNVILPIVIIVVWGVVLLLVDLFIPRNRKGWTALLSVVGLLIALFVTILRIGQGADANQAVFNGMVVMDQFSNYLNVLFLVSTLMAIALSYDYLQRMNLQQGEFYVLLLLSTSGMMLMGAAVDLIVVFLALELFSIPLYVLAGFSIPRIESEESSLKYFLLGSFSTGIIVYGTALIYGATSTTSIIGIVAAIEGGIAFPLMLLIGAAMVFIGLGFKVSIFPFHMWTPDVYEGAPTAVTAFMAAGAKAAGFAALLRIFVLAFPSLAVDLTPIIWLLAAFTMIFGNFVAIAQTNVKRLLAYSSIAQAGYLLMAMVAYGNPDLAADAVAASLFYLVAYTFTSFTAWAVVIMLEQAEGRGLSLNDYAGLGRKYPILGFAMTIAMLSFIGVPPTLGFVGKFYLFRTVIEAGEIWLALIGVLTSLVSAFYYLRIVVIMYMREGDPQATRDRWIYYTTLATAVATVVFSIFSEPLFNWASQAVMNLF